MAAAAKPADSQDAVFALLCDPATYGGGAVRRCETHAAVVFLAGDRALKVKRAVRYRFLDYSTLDKRKAACQAELDVNHKFAPQLYRRIVPIVRQADGSLALDGAGAAVEWAVEMTRFDEDKTLDHLAERGELDEALSAKLAIAVAAMHARAERVEAAPWLAAIAQFIRDNTAAFREHGELFSPDAVDELERKSQAALAKLRPLLEARGAAGLIRRGHGDLHLGNIAVLDGEPVAFDALEFDPIIAEGDVLYDLAFLLMDLIERGLSRPANVVLNGYFAASRRDEDCDGIAALPFFMSLRAAIRAKVTAARRDLAAGSRQSRSCAVGATLLRPCARTAYSDKADDRLHRWIIGHRQIDFGARAGAAVAATAGRPGVALGRRAQSAFRHPRARSFAGRGLSPRNIRNNLPPLDRQGQARRARRSLGRRRRRFRRSARARRD